ncbi:MAG: hypothetical protein R6W68_02000 [Ignavibacteriaceae bacterium]|jgi:hypothetical protein
MLVKIALALIIFWIVGAFMQHPLGLVIHTLPMISIVFILISEQKRIARTPNEY